MVISIEVRKVTQDVLLFVWFKHGALSEEPPREWDLIPELSQELMNNLSVSIWIESFRSQFIWDDFFKKHFKRMTSSSKLFANYVAYACYVLNESANAYECFFDILSIVSEFSLRCLERGSEKYLNTCVDLFCAFFEKELYQNFEDQGGWKKFNEYIRKPYNSAHSKSMVSDNKLPVNIFEYFPEALERVNRPDYVIGRLALKKKQPYYVVNGIVLKEITQKKVETHAKAISFVESIRSKLEKLVQKTFNELIRDFEKTYIEVKNLYRWEDEAFSIGMKSKEEEWYLVKPSRKKRQMVQSQEVQQSSGGMQSKGAQRKIDQESFGGMKNEVEQSSSQKVLELPGGMHSKGEKRKKDEESSDRMKNKVEQSSSQKVREPSSGMQSKGARQKIYQESSGGMKNQVEQCSSEKVQKPPSAMQSKEAQRKKDQESSGGMKNQVEQCSLQKNIEPPSGMQSKGEQRTKDEESSGGMKNQVKHYPLNFQETLEIVSCKTEVTRKELESQTVTARDFINTENLDTINLQDSVVPVQVSHLKLKSSRMETYKKLLGDMSLAITKLSGLIQSLCEKHRVKVPVQLQLNNIE